MRFNLPVVPSPVTETSAHSNELKVAAHLRDGERVVSSFGPYHATSHRVLLYRERNTGPEVHELPYNRLDRIYPVSASNHGLMLLGTVVVILSFLIVITMGLVTPLLAAIVGVAAVFYGSIGKPIYYQLHGQGMPEKELRRWQVRYRGAGSFIASIRTITGKSSAE